MLATNSIFYPHHCCFRAAAVKYGSNIVETQAEQRISLLKLLNLYSISTIIYEKFLNIFKKLKIFKYVNKILFRLGQISNRFALGVLEFCVHLFTFTMTFCLELWLYKRHNKNAKIEHCNV